MEHDVHRIDLALALASDSAKAGEEKFPLDKVRMQKAVFLVAMRGTPRLKSLYRFLPYNWGPYSGDLTADVDSMIRAGQVAVRQTPGRQHGGYETTQAGEVRGSQVWANLEPNEQQFIQSVRNYVTNRSFEHLLREIYAEYPDFATKSRFRG